MIHILYTTGPGLAPAIRLLAHGDDGPMIRDLTAWAAGVLSVDDAWDGT